MRIIGRSKALHATWFFLPTFRLLLDCGESACLELGTQTTDVDFIFLSHMHTDHWSGLLSVARFQKRVTLKDKTRSMATILYHKDFKPTIDTIKKFLESGELRLFFKYQEISEDQPFHLRDNFYLTPFLVEHTAPYYKNKLTALGMNLVERRKRLNSDMAKKKKEFDKKHEKEPHRAQEEFTKLIIDFKKNKGEIGLMEEYDYKLLSYCGDSRPVEPKLVENTEILMHESTFFEEEDVDAAHSSVEEAIDVAKKSNCKNLILYHFSERYQRERINYIKKAQIIAEEKKLTVPLHLVSVNRLFIKDVDRQKTLRK